MACLIRQMKAGENRFTNDYIKNGQTYDDDCLSIISTTDDATQIQVKIDFSSIITFEILRKEYIEQQYDKNLNLDELVTQLFLNTIQSDIEVWHMSEECLRIVSQFNSTPNHRILMA